MSTLKVVNIQHPSAASATLILDSSGNLALPAGSASTPALQGPSDTNTGLFFPEADTIAFTEGGTEALRINSSGRVGIGISSVDANSRVHIFDSSLSRQLLIQGDANDAAITVNKSGQSFTFGIDASDSNKFKINTGNTVGAADHITIDTSGRLGIGTTAPNAKVEVASTSDNTQFRVTSSFEAALWLANGGGSELNVINSAGSGNLSFRVSNNEKMRMDSSGRLLVGTLSSSSNAKLVVQNRITGSGPGFIDLQRGSTPSVDGTGLGQIDFSGSDTNVGAQIVAVSDGGGWTAGANHRTRLVFSTTADGGTSPTERMKLDRNGVITLGLDGVRFCVFRPSGSFAFRGGDVGDGFIRCEDPSANAKFTVSSAGNGVFAGSLSKGSGSFKISHPLLEKTDTHYLVHSFIEGPQADLIYRGHVTLVNGTAQVNIDEAGRMTEGTFEALCTNVCCFTSNETDWTPVRGHVDGNILTIEAQDPTSSAEVCWIVIGERKDQHMLDTDWTDEYGRVITEPLKEMTTHEAA